jgi:hypothetical protein
MRSRAGLSVLSDGKAHEDVSYHHSSQQNIVYWEKNGLIYQRLHKTL